ncbi:MAG: class I SAM-dependent methyltransferase [Saprospiraceae bacterium]|nr:class I SAM-dependent methyltransferase [Saprospiraceae bacterium]
MELQQAVSLIAAAVKKENGIWADVGAGTGLFTLALQHLLHEGTIYALDKNPHALWKLASSKQVCIKVEEADFTKELSLPTLDGIIMANALHYAPEPVVVFNQLLSCLKPKGVFILVEYETNTPNFPWIPYPIPLQHFKAIVTASQHSLSQVIPISTVPSVYSTEHIYSAYIIKE